jgi:hypothetical protein
MYCLPDSRTVLLDVTRPVHAYFVDPWWKAHGPNFPDWGPYSDGGRFLTAVAHDVAVRRVKPPQAIERSDAQPVRLMSDRELLEIIQGGSHEPVDDPSYPRICGPSEPLRSAK